MEERMEQYFSGSFLYGDDFSPDQISEWFKSERDASYALKAASTNRDYAYHALNIEHGFSRLPNKQFMNVLGIGSGWGQEFEPILDRCQHITILEPADGFVNPRFSYVKPDPLGKIPFPDRSFDLILCLGVLHHIPNVSFVMKEIGRVSDGHLLVSEPIVTMGDWRYARRGLTANERGIPIEILRRIVREAGFEVLREQKCMFSLTSRLRYLVRQHAYNVRWVVKLDAFLAPLPFWYQGYHSRTWVQKLRAINIYYVLKRLHRGSERMLH